MLEDYHNYTMFVKHMFGGEDFMKLGGHFDSGRLFRLSKQGVLGEKGYQLRLFSGAHEDGLRVADL